MSLADDLTARPDAPVLLVCGPTAVVAARELLPAYIVASWATADYFGNEPGGPITNGALKPLAGRKVDLWVSTGRYDRWPHDGTVRELLSLGCALRLIEPEPTEIMEPGVAKMSGWDSAKLIEFARSRVRAVTDVPRETVLQPFPDDFDDPPPPDHDEKVVPLKRGKPRTKANGQPPAGVQYDDGAISATSVWQALALDLDGKGMPYPNIANVKRLLAADTRIIGRLWYDEFHHRVYSTFFSEEPSEWTDRNDTDLCAWVQSVLRIPKLGIDVVKRSVESVAHANTRHELREWLQTLTWDGRERLEHLLSDAYGAEQNPYTAAVGRCWLVSMIARAFKPGCQVDTIVVFEGSQGIRKSSSLSILGGKWYASLPDPFGSKDFLQSIDGVWLAEIPDMSSFKGRDIQHVKAIITTRIDRYRRSYGYHAESYPRQCVFSATANGSDWNQDPTGARRFWPIACTAINIECLTANREQLFAEALHLYKAGGSWWDVPETDARAEQDKRREVDAWQEILETWCSYTGRDTVTVNEIFDGPIPLPVERRNQVAIKHIATVLRALGYERVTKRLGGKLMKCWERRVTGNISLQKSLIDQ